MDQRPMNEILRKQIWRKLESLPEEKVYAVLDYIEFLESEYGDRSAGAPTFQRFAEAFQKQLRRSRVPASAMRETMKVLGAADRVLDAFREAGREFLAELETGRPEPPLKQEDEKPPQPREIVVE
ncbi:MAG: hypothetical protein ACRELC_08480 [Gemmatimonadota bacterium]